ncbi:MAG: Acetyl-coenzyme A carboxylase carboxyl transferase subunit beta [Owenweeksia sp. TMED14]|nr:MAG: Acetyl-coenzyme A carboxylase carboxyl transferase subunit beta [Owenweeksia sp. TMED14]|tara:strand:+ start:2096 stop:2971 length:876 start_codon:yes stop_codon:yes gene_type:complete
MSSDWFQRQKEGITTPTQEKKETPDGLWHGCPKCKVIVSRDEYESNLWVCANCGHHNGIEAKEYFSFLFDNGEYAELNPNLISLDPLNFEDTKKYSDRLIIAKRITGLKDAITTANGNLSGMPVAIAAMNFKFIGGSMGSVVGEKISRTIDFSLKHKIPFIMISKSGGARMMEAAFSLMQMAKTSSKLALLDEAKIPYVSLLTNPTTGGVTASFAMLGDINIAEPAALIGFAGPRIVRETIGKDLPEGFQTSEFVKDHGFIDFIVKRAELKSKISDWLECVGNLPKPAESE